MNSDYTDVVNEISQVLFNAVSKREPKMRSMVHGMDRELYKLLRAVGLQVMSMLFTWLSTQLTLEAKATGLIVQRRKQVKYVGLFGELEVESPDLWDKKSHRGARPVKDQLGIEHGGRSVAVLRALADFGAEESFGQAAKRFEEHYGWAIDRATVRREVEHTALKAEQYVEMRLLSAGLDYSQPLEARPGNEQVLVELDGCHIRTGKKIIIKEAEFTKKRRLPCSQRPSDWREVRVGLARSLEQKEQRTYVARMSKYPEVIQQLVREAVDRGMSERSKVIAVADGAIGLREELEAQFLNLTFILDRPHLKQHLYEGAEAIGLTGVERHQWVSDKLHAIDAGDVRRVITTLKKYRGIGQKRLVSLFKHLQRFVDAVDYDYFRALGLPIGSGEVESAHRYLPQKRLKIPGATWHPDTINPMLALRIIRANNWWEDFWTQQDTASQAFLAV
jgi:hypothetical protein